MSSDVVVTARKALSFVNVALSFAGLSALGVSGADLAHFAPEFAQGMAARARLLGDEGPNDPNNWPSPFRTSSHAIVIVGSDSVAGLRSGVDRVSSLAQSYGVATQWRQDAGVRADAPGYEHFGFRDGISQPGIYGYTPVSNPAVATEGRAGQSLVFAGEFILGQPRQAGAGRPIDVPGPIAVNGPKWSVNGSYLVLRRLSQDVGGFRSFVAAMASSTGLSPAASEAKVVGRYPSGVPLERAGVLGSDPGPASGLTGEFSIDNFGYTRDLDGVVVPLASHIRKANPRDEPTDTGGPADTLTRRILRRGAVYGSSLASTATGSALANPTYPNDRGLMFACYQWNIAHQFEFISTHWINNPNFPRRGAGSDPLVSQDPNGSFVLGGSKNSHVSLLQRFVTTTGGDYFFCPSISAVAALGASKEGTL